MRKKLRGILLILGLVFFALVMRRVLNPFGKSEFAEIPHGDHVHYIPKDRDTSIPISRFPTRPPGDNERILPDGRIVPR